MSSPSSSTDWRVWQDRQIAHGFTDARRAAVPGTAAQQEIMLRLLARVSAPRLTILDVGCGDGILTAAAEAAFALKQAVLLDGSPAMLERARARFAQQDAPVTFVQADFNDPAWTAALPFRDFDAVLSGFAIHHSEDARKRGVYAEIFGLLKPGGVFINIEHVGSTTSLGEALFERTYAENWARLRRERGEQVTDEQAYQEVTMRPDKAANRLAPVETQLQWLREIGYVDVDCYWKYFELAILAGYKISR